MTLDPLSRRFWVIRNVDWLMNEVIFWRDNHRYYKNDRVLLWNLGDDEGEVTLDEITK